MAVTTLHPNAIFTSTVTKSIEKMKVVLTEPAYLHHVVAFAGCMFQNNAFLQPNGRLFLMRFCDGSETRIIHCKNVWLLMIIVFVRPSFDKIMVKHDAFSTYENNAKHRGVLTRAIHRKKRLF